MIAERIDDTHLRVPARAESAGTLGDGSVVIDSTHPDYESWVRYMATPSYQSDIAAARADEEHLE